ncbi:MAG: SRPBCC family protein, partial [Nitrosotalea sp.]
KFTFSKDSDRRHTEMDSDFVSEGRILEFVQNKKLAYTWQWNSIPDFPETIVTWELEQIGENKTRLTLTHSGFTGKEEGKLGLKGHDEGWSFFLNELSSYCKKK